MPSRGRPRSGSCERDCPRRRHARECDRHERPGVAAAPRRTFHQLQVARASAGPSARCALGSFFAGPRALRNGHGTSGLWGTDGRRGVRCHSESRSGAGARGQPCGARGTRSRDHASAGKGPKMRYQTAADMRSELTRLGRTAAPVPSAPPATRKLNPLFIAVPVLAILAVAAWLFWRSAQPPGFTERDTIVIADFENTTGDPVFDEGPRQAVSVLF